MKKILACLFLAGCLGLTSGCSTIAVRCAPAEARRDLPLYPATQLDVWTVRTGGGFYAHGDCDNGLGPVFGWLVAVPLSIVDLPISLVTDTLFLPADVFLPRPRTIDETVDDMLKESEDQEKSNK